MFGPPRACPVCNGFEFRPSQKTGVTGFFAAFICLRPFRCYSCGGRVWRFSRSGQPLGKRWKAASSTMKPVVIVGKTTEPVASEKAIEANPS